VTPRSGRSRRAFAALALTLAALAACTAPTLTAARPPSTALSNGAPGTGPTVGATTPVTTTPVGSTSGPSTTPTIGATSTPTKPHVLTLVESLSRLPKFGPAPVPEPMLLPHSSGQAPLISRIPTTLPVAFLTIDDGIWKVPDAIPLLRAAGIPVTLFLTINDISDDPGYFARLQAAGAVIESHTVTHPDLRKLGYGQQVYEICHATDVLGQWYGRRPVFFRPPFGFWNPSAMAAAASCGLTAGFLWRETVNAGVVRYQTKVHMIAPGDIILMHFRPTFDEDFVAALRAIKAAGLTPALLEDYVVTS
jgi:peptidoglycan/xylan/chitin deacetylase (PgdA/CDA1 family)